MGAVNFDPSEFSEVGETARVARPAIPDSKIAAIAEIAAGLSPEIKDGLDRLAGRSPPMYIAPDRWLDIVGDAQALATPDPVAGYSMADRAMRLGWDARDLFGWSSEDWISLSVWAKGRPIHIMSDDAACPVRGDSPAIYRVSPRPENVKYLWEL